MPQPAADTTIGTFSMTLGNYPQSTINYSLSTINNQQSTIHYPPSSISVLPTSHFQPHVINMYTVADMADENTPQKVNKSVAIAVFFTLIITIPTYFFYRQYKESTDPAKASERETEKLVTDISRIMNLPEGETPQVLGVADHRQLADQPFFDKAKTGDKILIYEKTGLIIIYDPQAKRIIDVADIEDDSN